MKAFTINPGRACRTESSSNSLFDWKHLTYNRLNHSSYYDQENYLFRKFLTQRFS